MGLDTANAILIQSTVDAVLQIARSQDETKKILQDGVADRMTSIDDRMGSIDNKMTYVVEALNLHESRINETRTDVDKNTSNIENLEKDFKKKSRVFVLGLLLSFTFSTAALALDDESQTKLIPFIFKLITGLAN